MGKNFFISYQGRVWDWMLKCFSRSVAMDVNERNHRFLEESLELVQSLGTTREEALMLVDYVYNRPLGSPPQEIGGVMVTLAALANASSIDMQDCAEEELTRICNDDVIRKIRAKQATKPHSSPLPGTTF